MPNLPVRGLGDIGVIADIDPYDLPPSAWSDARNVRFDSSGISRASVFKPFIVPQDFTSPPLYAVDDTLRDTSKGFTTLRQDGTLTRLNEGEARDVSPTVPLAGVTSQVTGTICGSVSYINTGDEPPISYASGEDRYERIPNWTETDRCRAFRSYGDFLIALNVSRPSVTFPNMVKWSDATGAGVRPRWDVTEDNSLAGENVLNGSTGYIIDGMELGNAFLIYGSREVFRMDYIGGDFVFNFEKLFNDVSIMTQNCVTQNANKHFVFCEGDIIVTDGISKESICNEKVRNRIFGTLDYSKRDQCRVIHNSAKSEIIFAYPSCYGRVAWEAGDVGCNEGAVFNYEKQTWSFIDLPNVTFGCLTLQPRGASGLSANWDGLANWSALKSNWTFSAASPSTLVLTAAGQVGKPANVYFYDDLFNGRTLNEPDEDLIWSAWGEMVLCDFDTVGFPLNDRKLLKSFAPQVFTNNSEDSVLFHFRGDNLSVNDLAWGAPVSFNPYIDTKKDTRANGRTISVRFTIPEGVSARMSGFDLNLMRIAGR